MTTTPASNTPINHVSDTALWVAAFRADETARPDALYKDPLAAALTGERGRKIARAMPFPKILAWIMAVRTVAIDKLIFDALADGVDMVINLGAGLDTRPYRLEKLPANLRWVEIDFPHLIALKEEKLKTEMPRCQLERVALDLSNRASAQRAYAELGSRAKKALVITEGVIPYLTNEQAGQLADDLRAVPTFANWIQDWRKDNETWRQPGKLRSKLKNSPFQFKHPEPLEFFAEHGWKAKQTLFAIEEGERLGRKFPIPFPWSLLARFMPKEKRDLFRTSSGYVLLEREAGK